MLSASILLGSALGTPVLAENTTTGSTQVNYTVAESYSWTAPADIAFTANSNGSEVKAGTVNVTKNTIGSGKTLKIGIANDQTFELTDTANSSNKRTYTVKDGSTALSSGSEVLSVAAGTDTATKSLSIQMTSVGTEVAGTYSGTLRFVSTIENTGTGSGGGSSTGSNPYAAKVAHVQKLYDVGEANLTADDIVTVNGIECYVLKADATKAELITVEIYYQGFNHAHSTYNYANSELKSYMDNFYTNQLGSDPYILDTNVTYRYKDSYSDDLSTYNTGTVIQKAFALDAVEAQANASKFSWESEHDWGKAFWLAAGYYDDGDPCGWSVSCDGNFDGRYASGSYAGARPAFWISLESGGSGGSGGGSSTISVAKSDIVTMSQLGLTDVDANNDSVTDTFRVLSVDGSNVKLLAMDSYKSADFNSTPDNTYSGSTLDTEMNNYYNALPESVKSAIVEQNINQLNYSRSYSSSASDMLHITGLNSRNYYYYANTTTNVGNRNVFALDIQDIIDYLGSDITGAQLNEMFFNSSESVSRIVWLRSDAPGSDYAFRVDGNIGFVDYNYFYQSGEVHPAFVLNLG